jgi:hypothetical protein
VDIAVTTTHCQKSSASLIEARVWAGIHYRFSTKVGEEMGRQIAEYVLRNSLLALN